MRPRFSITAAVLLLALTGCSASLPTDGPLMVHPRPEMGMDALLAGTLRLVDDCVMVEAEDGSFLVPSFPSGDASWSDGTLTWKGSDYREGEDISLGGGGGGSTSSISGVYVPEGCRGHDSFIVSPF